MASNKKTGTQSIQQGMPQNCTGHVCSIIDNKHYGFIKPASALPAGYSQKDVHFHFSRIQGSDLSVGDKVYFVLDPDKREMPTVLKVQSTPIIMKDPESSGASREPRNVNKMHTHVYRRRSRSRNLLLPSKSLQTMEIPGEPSADNGAMSKAKPHKHNAGSTTAEIGTPVPERTRKESNKSKLRKKEKSVGLQQPFASWESDKISDHWHSGQVCSIHEHKQCGFIQPECALPQGYLRKDVHFHFSRIIGPQPHIGERVYFVLDRQIKEKPTVQSITVQEPGGSHVSTATDNDNYKQVVSGDISNFVTEEVFNSSNQMRQQSRENEWSHQTSSNTVPDSWHSGYICSIIQKAQCGFIQPEYALPQGYLQKDVHFHFSEIIGPQPHVGDRVYFVLDQSNKGKPTVLKVQSITSEESMLPQGSIVSTDTEEDIYKGGNAESLMSEEVLNAYPQLKTGENDLVHQTGQDSWHSGYICSIIKKAQCGFIQPEYALPQGYHQKDVHFHFSRILGSHPNVGDKVYFILDPAHTEKPTVQYVQSVTMGDFGQPQDDSEVYYHPESSASQVPSSNDNNPDQYKSNIQDESMKSNQPVDHSSSGVLATSYHVSESGNTTGAESQPTGACVSYATMDEVDAYISGLIAKAITKANAHNSDTGIDIKQELCPNTSAVFPIKWYSGHVCGIAVEKNCGFIKPDTQLPSRYNNQKDVHFNFSKIQGPLPNNRDKVYFILDPENTEKPTVLKVQLETVVE